jgi:hypothetical protein
MAANGLGSWRAKRFFVRTLGGVHGAVAYGLMRGIVVGTVRRRSSNLIQRFGGAWEKNPTSIAEGSEVVGRSQGGQRESV